MGGNIPSVIQLVLSIAFCAWAAKLRYGLLLLVLVHDLHHLSRRTSIRRSDWRHGVVLLQYGEQSSTRRQRCRRTGCRTGCWCFQQVTDRAKVAVVSVCVCVALTSRTLVYR